MTIGFTSSSPYERNVEVRKENPCSAILHYKLLLETLTESFSLWLASVAEVI